LRDQFVDGLAGPLSLLLAITIYVLSDDLAWRPRVRG
jgi:hypothetical protein